jgi:hypothetical protein
MKSARQKLGEKSLKVLEKYKSYFGFSDWEVSFEDRSDESNVSIARTAINHHEKLLKVIIFEQFIDEDTNRDNVLIHELLHARHEVKAIKIKEKIADIEYHEEEDMVNDITRGFMRFINDLNSEKKKPSRIVLPKNSNKRFK